jgi:hypothetical protein
VHRGEDSLQDEWRGIEISHDGFAKTENISLYLPTLHAAESDAPELEKELSISVIPESFLQLFLLFFEPKKLRWDLGDGSDGDCDCLLRLIRFCIHTIVFTFVSSFFLVRAHHDTS